MKKNKIFILFVLVIILLVGCTKQELFVNENNEITITTIEEIEKKQTNAL